jgi:glucuronoarabinoxylan endo-1,4-beta-xylanase
LLPQYYENYASWLNQAANSIKLDYVSFQNEPDMGTSSIAWTPTQMLTFVKNNSSAIGKPVVMPESFRFDDAYSDPTLDDSTAVAKITFVGGHIYGGSNTVHQNAINHGKRVWMTEHYQDGTNIGTCLSIAKEISDCMNNQMSAYIWWWVNDSYACNLVNRDGTIFKNGYTIGQFAKWIRPGKKRIATTYNPSANVYVTAYHNGGLVIVTINTGDTSVSQPFALRNMSDVTTLNVNRTSSGENMAGVGVAAVTNNSFTYTLPAQSITTFHQY